MLRPAILLALLPITGVSAQQLADLGVKRHLPRAAAVTQAVVLGDVDLDGDLDVMVGNGALEVGSPGQSNRLYLNDGTGVFTDAGAPRMPSDTDDTRSLVLADVDGDGAPDLVVGNAGRNRLYSNVGAGVFLDVTATQLPADNDITEAVALGDVDGDGDADLVCGNSRRAKSGGAQNRLYLNDGAGTFTDTTTRLPVQQNSTEGLALGDVDGDGDLDLVLGDRQRIALHLNDGTGTFTDVTASHVPIPPSGSGITSLAVGDLDGDGDLDVVAGHDRLENFVLLNDGSGHYTAGPNALPRQQLTAGIALGDVDGDGDLDVWFGNAGIRGVRNRLLFNNGAARFADGTPSRLPIDDDDTAAGAFGDVDGDGDLDLVFGNETADSVWCNDGTGSFWPPPAGRFPLGGCSTSAVVAGDLDGDGDVDLVLGVRPAAACRSMQTAVFINSGRGYFTAIGNVPADTDPTHGLALGDVDGDGDLDLVLAKAATAGGAQNRLYLNDGKAGFADASANRLPVDADDSRSVLCADVDGDGDADLLFATGSIGCT